MSRIVGIYDQASGVRALVGDLVSSYRYYAISGNLDEQAILLKTISELEEEANGLQAEVSDICYEKYRGSGQYGFDDSLRHGKPLPIIIPEPVSRP